MNHRLIRRCTAVLFLTGLVLPLQAQEQEPTTELPWGHSSHGAAYDEGPRQKPWLMEGIGSTHFPITSSHPEVQQWFDQAITLMHGFWWYEAERSLRWCLKLDPECAMAYWGLSLATRTGPEELASRSADFLAEAAARKGTVTERERAYIEVAEAFQAARDAGEEDKEEAEEEAMESIDRLLMDYPDDVEAKAQYWLSGYQLMERDAGLLRYGFEAVLDDILEVDPDHVGALHYRVHNWDGEDGHFAIDTCLKLGAIASRCGHLLHMPGHVLSGIGLWHEAAIAMDRATRVEKAYMHERMILPEDNWDYAHNLDYLCYIQEQLGMVDQALLGARQLLLAPAPHDMGPFGSMLKAPALRALIKYERWGELLELLPRIVDEGNPLESVAGKYARARALMGTGQLEAAREIVDGMRQASAGGPGAGGPPFTAGPGGPGGPDPEAGGKPDPAVIAAAMVPKATEMLLPELEALLAIAEGDTLEGLAQLHDAAEAQTERWYNDPPHEPSFLYNLLGDAYLELGAAKLAVECYERTLETVFLDGFALAGLVVAYDQIGEAQKAAEAMGKLAVVWSDADRPNRWLEAAEATGVVGEPWSDPRLEQRNYKEHVLDVEGPSLWERSELPELTALDADGDPVALSDFRDQNVLLIFYLGETCVHCIEQINLAEERIEELEAQDAVVLAVSRDEVEEIARQQESLGIMLLSDEDFQMARRFHSFDDFEEIELHSTFLIDREGRLHWSRIGGDPFTDFDYLLSELERLNEGHEPQIVGGEAESKPGAGQ